MDTSTAMSATMVTRQMKTFVTLVTRNKVLPTDFFQNTPGKIGTQM